MLNIELLFVWNYLNNWNDTLKIKIKLPAGGGKSLILFIQLIRLNGWIIQEGSKWQPLTMGDWITDSLDSFKNAVRS